ncbi:hypothetical protein ACOKFD_15815 [Flagellimonas sp. S174]|uniref:hypothetical protein n=1 Tax=Flagellimonas sp. S174 TaxID=3410790 RepID=UPI003BF5B89B
MRARIHLDERKSSETKNGFPIVLEVTGNYKQKRIRIGYHSRPSEWNMSRSAPKSNHPQYYQLNDFLLDLKIRMNELLANRLKNGLTVENFKEKLFNSGTSPIFLESCKSQFPEGYEGTKLSALRSFDKYYPKATFSEITFDKVARYIKSELAKPRDPSGVDSYIRSLRALWNKNSDEKNPFKGHRISIPAKIKRISTKEDLRKFASAELSDKGEIASFSKIRYYWLLMFYFGGIDPEVLAKLRYDENIQNGRVIFNRNKGGSKMSCNNIIVPQALEILEMFDCKPYLVPIHKTGNYDSFIRNFRRGLIKISEQLELGSVMHPKSARYTFIDTAQQELIDERITAQIVGHKRRTVTSLYTNDFPLDVQDKAHRIIVGL